MNSRIYDEMLVQYIDASKAEAARRLIEAKVAKPDADLIKRMLGIEPDGEN